MKFLSFCCLCFLLFSCQKSVLEPIDPPEDPEDPVITVLPRLFALPVQVAPLQANYQIGDTIYIDVQLPDSALIDQNQGDAFDVDYVQLRFSFEIQVHDFPEQTTYTGSSFNVLLENGYFTITRHFPNRSIFVFDNLCLRPPEVAFRLAIIPQQVGIFSIKIQEENITWNANFPCDSPPSNIPEFGGVEYFFEPFDFHPSVVNQLSEEAINEINTIMIDQINNNQLFFFQILE